MPLNAKEILDYAHSYGIELLWGFAWGWKRSCQVTTEEIDTLEEQILRRFETDYRDIACDGIYFQSFTERCDDSIEGRSIASRVTELVNRVSARLLEAYPGLHIQFGLHATSVKDHLYEIAQTDPRVEIVWEDCGEFPSGYTPQVKSEEAYLATEAFARDIVTLRPGAPVGYMFKGFATLDWHRFVHQAGPFVLGESAPEIIEHDRAVRSAIWRQLTAKWAVNGKYAQRMAKLLHEVAGENINMCMAANFDGGLWLPGAACAQMFWDPTADFDTLWQWEASKGYLTQP